ncbi:glycosyltransferase [Fervidobacterium thailandense]
MEKVVAVVPTFNRSSTLTRCIQSLLSQTHPLYKILIVDNNSGEKHKEKILQLIRESPNLVEALFLDENYGGAGGFEKGVRFAFEKFHPDFLWLMDDDAYPTESCLENLVQTYKTLTSQGRPVGAVAPLIQGIDTGKYQFYHHKRVSSVILKEKPVKSTFEELEDIEELDANAFVGLLVPRRSIEIAGTPDGSFFIYGDDTEYTLRLSRKFKLKIYLVKKSVIYHQDTPQVNGSVPPQQLWKYYYQVRNKYLMLESFGKNRMLKEYSKLLFTLSQVKSLIACLIKTEYRGYRRLRFAIILKGILHGLLRYKGKTLSPENFKIKGN